MPRENFYILLEISVNPSEHNGNVISQAISKKQAEWSALRPHPTKGRRAQLYSSLIPEIKKTMADDALRKIEADEARDILYKQEKEKYKEMDAAIALLSSKGSLLEKEIAVLAKRYKNVPEADIRKRVKVPITKDKSTAKKTTHALDDTTFKKITSELEIIGKNSLYEFLDVAPSSSLKFLQDATRQKSAEIKKISVKDAAVTASGVLVGHCLNVLKSEDMRKAYDTAIGKQKLSGLKEDMETVASHTREISKEVYDALVKKAVKHGIHQGEADECIREYCRKRKWSLVVPDRLSIIELRECRFCGVMNTLQVNHCSNCGQPMALLCPKCGKQDANVSKTCTQCGFFFGDMPNTLRWIRKAQVAYLENDLDTALNLYQKAEFIWPGHTDIQKGKKEVLARKQSIDGLATQIKNQVANRQFFKAKQTLLQLGTISPNHPNMSLQQTVDDHVEAARLWCEKAKKLKGSNDRISAYTNALAECGDYQEAIGGLARTPPDAPVNLKAADVHHAISLNWTASSSFGDLTYRVVRKASGRPSKCDDGDILAETAVRFYDDNLCEPGQLYFYSVFTLRGQVPSRTGATAGPVLRTADVKHLKAIPGDSRIQLQWTLPAKASSVEVRIKARGVPSGINDGNRVAVQSRNHTVISGVRNSQIYGIWIAAVYRDSKGQTLLSKGVSVQASPCRPPDPVRQFNVQKKGPFLDIRWTSPQDGSVVIVHSLTPFGVKSGQMIEADKISELGGQIPVLGQNNTQWKEQFQGILYVMPITVKGNIGVTGAVQSITSINDVRKLTSEMNGGKLYLEWQWPDGAQYVLVAYRHDRYPESPSDSQATKMSINRSTYDRYSGFVIQKSEKKDYYFFVYVQSSMDKQAVFSTGKRCLAANSGFKEIYYEIKINRTLFKKPKSAELIILGMKLSGLPRLYLVKMLNRLPNNPNEGIPILKTDEWLDDDITNPDYVTIPIPKEELEKDAYAKLFFKNNDDTQRWRLMVPNKKKLQLF